MPESIVYVAASSIHGKGLFARSFIPSGTVIGVVQGQPTKEDGDYVLWLDGKDGFHVQCHLRYINHSNTPNAAYHNNLEVCAIQDIYPGDEITHHYGPDWE